MIELNNIIKNDIKSNVQNFEYLVNIDDKIFVATRKQMLQVGSDSVFYEDVGIKVSNIGEKIDLKDKKTQLSSVSISFQNFSKIKDNSEGRFSDEFIDMVGKRVKIYFKTQSCKTLDECLLISQVKITRVTHDSKQIQISCNDLGVDKLLKDMPSSENILVKGINTFDHYSLKPVPTLYGHLESAPAVVYKEEADDSFEIKLLPDTSYLDNSEIGGIARFDTDGSQSILLDDGENLIQNNRLQLVRQNVVKIGLGDHICDIPCLPYQQTRRGIVTDTDNILHTQSQWFSNQNHILFNQGVIGNVDNIVESSILWCSLNEKPITQQTKSYHISNEVGLTSEFEGLYFYGSQEPNDFNLNSTMYLEDGYKTYHNNVGYTVGVQTFKIKPFSGYDLNELKDDTGDIIVKTDIHFVGNLSLKHLGHFSNTTDAETHLSTTIHSVFSSPTHDDDAQGEFYDGEHSDFWNGSNRINGIGYPISISDDITGAYTSDRDNFNTKFRRASLRTRGYDDVNLNEWQDYRSSFLSQNLDHTNYNSFVSRYHVNFGQSTYPTLDASVMSLYYFPHSTQTDTHQYVLNEPPEVRYSIEANWRDLEIRKVWSNKKIFEKDFFVNAKGKLGDEEPNVKDISGHMIIKHEGTDPAYGNNDEGADNLHFTELYKLLTNAEYKTKTIDGEVYELMLASYDITTQKYSYMYDVEIEDISFLEGNLPDFLSNASGDDPNAGLFWVSGVGNVVHDVAWFVKFNSKLLGDSQNEFEGRSSVAGVRLIYGKKIYENRDVIDVEIYEGEGDNDLNLFNEKNGYIFGEELQDAFDVFIPFGYTFVSWDNETPSKKLLERPHEIVGHLLTEQVSIINFDEDKINKIYEQTPEYKLAFSINERENTNDIIQKICQQSTIYYRYRGRDEKVVLDIIKATYSEDDVNGIINVDNMKNFSFKKTNIEDSCIGGVVVNYAYNYSTKNFDKRTAKRDTGVLKTAYVNMYGVDGVEGLADYEVELDAPYIQDEATAKYFRDYYFESHKQPKLVCKFDLPTHEGLSYEVGDIIRFNKDPNSTAPYGRSLTSQHEVLEQIVTPYFFITNTQKSLFKVSIECVQIHEANLNLPEVTLLGDINLDGQITIDEDDPNSDLNLLLDMVLHGTHSYTTQQLLNADVDGDGIIDIQDFIRFLEMYGDE